MSGDEHRTEAERLLHLVGEFPPSESFWAQVTATAALAHATLAAAIGLSETFDITAWGSDESIATAPADDREGNS